MVRKGLVTALVAVALGAVLLLATGCSQGRAAAQSSPQPWLVSVHDVSLLRNQPADFWFHTTGSHRLTVIILAERPLDSATLFRVALGVGMREEVSLQGSPHPSGKRHVVYALKAEPIRAGGYYRLSLAGRGRIESLVVRDW
jgi:hypothetical protein